MCLHEAHADLNSNRFIHAPRYRAPSDVRATSVVNGIGYSLLHLGWQTLLQHLRYLAVPGGMRYLAGVLVGVGVVC
jgi:hypothetical protein